MKKILFVFLFLLAVAPVVYGQNSIDVVQLIINTIMEKHEAVFDKIIEIQEKLQNVENNLQELHHEVEDVKGAVFKNEESLKRLSNQTERGLQVLEDSHNVTLSGQENLETSFQKEISGIISLLETGRVEDECSKGSHNCGPHGICANTLFSFNCSCLPGFILSDSGCQDVDECSLGIADCGVSATCVNSLGSYNCVCNPPLTGDGRICSGFECKSPDIFIEGIGCITKVMSQKTWPQFMDYCTSIKGRMLQSFSLDQLQDMGRDFAYIFAGGWIGVKDGHWAETGESLEDKFWKAGYESGSSDLCGYTEWVSYNTYRLNQRPCSATAFGYCQLNL